MALNEHSVRDQPSGWCPARPCGVADRPVRLWKPGNAGGGKGPDFWHVSGRDQQSGDWLCLSCAVEVNSAMVRVDDFP